MDLCLRLAITRILQLYMAHYRQVLQSGVTEQNTSVKVTCSRTQGRRHGMCWGEHVHHTFARGRSSDECRSDECEVNGDQSGMTLAALHWFSSGRLLMTCWNLPTI